MDNGRTISLPESFEGWNIYKFIKGRKRALITLLSTGITYIITDNELASVLAGLIIEGLFSIGDFYYNKQEIN